MHGFLGALAIIFDDISPAAAFASGQTFKRYRKTGGPRRHLVADFVIGAHAEIQADRLPAIDRGYLGKWFPGLTLLAPRKR